VLVNNAGIAVPPNRVDVSEEGMFLPTEKTTAADVMTIMKTNVAAVVELTSVPLFSHTGLCLIDCKLLTDALLPLLAKSDAPRIVNVSSARGSLSFESGLPSERTGSLVYNASKAALSAHLSCSGAA
jgi:NAD(P)-dependent dehydrogenase (short-subunit alcohol dehydrogenase family)